MSDESERNPAIGQGAYRTEPLKYIGVIESERRRRVGTDEFIEEWGVRNQLGAVIFLAKEQVRLGEVEAPAPATPSASRGTPRTSGRITSAARAPARAGAPLAVKVIGGLWVGFFSFFVLIWAALFLAFLFSDSVTVQGGPPHLVIPAMGVIGGLLLYTGIALLRLKPWAREVIVILCGLSILVSIPYGLFLLIGALASSMPAAFRLLVVLAVLLGMAPYYAIWHFLRSEKVRQAFER